MPTTKTIGKKMPANRSATLSFFDLFFAASFISSAIRSSVDSLPTCVTLILAAPESPSVPDNALSPTTFSTGTDSPVTDDSLIKILPCITTPSAGTLAPAVSTTTSPSLKLSAGTSSVLPFISTTAVLGFKANNSFTAFLVCDEVRHSKILADESISTMKAVEWYSLRPNDTASATKLNASMVIESFKNPFTPSQAVGKAPSPATTMRTGCVPGTK